MKLMYAAWGDDVPHRLRDARLHERLAAAGVRRLQLNLDDAELQERLTTLMASVSRIGFDHDIDLVPSSRYVYDFQSS